MRWTLFSALDRDTVMEVVEASLSWLWEQLSLAAAFSLDHEPVGGMSLFIHECLLCRSDHQLILRCALGGGKELLHSSGGKNTYFCLGCQRENDFMETQHYGGSRKNLCLAFKRILGNSYLDYSC